MPHVRRFFSWLRVRLFSQSAAWSVTVLLLAGFVVLLLGGYVLGWNWTGFGATTTAPPAPLEPEYQPARTLWDWLDLLIVPVVLAVAAYLFNRAERRNEQAIAHDRFSENTLQTYLTQMSELLLDKDMALTDGSLEARTVARMRTLTALRQLDASRKAVVLTFLWDARLIRRSLERAAPPLIDLRGADLRHSALRGTNLRSASLRRVELSRADLRDANVSEADLSDANLRGADLRGTDLSSADLSGADLRGADLRSADLHGTRLKFADLRDADLRGARVNEKTDFWDCTWEGAKLGKGVAAHLKKARGAGSSPDRSARKIEGKGKDNELE
jgi:uncharacterized protein YjbI with pentapeptide repeats